MTAKIFFFFYPGLASQKRLGRGKHLIMDCAQVFQQTEFCSQGFVSGEHHHYHHISRPEFQFLEEHGGCSPQSHQIGIEQTLERWIFQSTSFRSQNSSHLGSLFPYPITGYFGDIGHSFSHTTSKLSSPRYIGPLCSLPTIFCTHFCSF